MAAERSRVVGGWRCGEIVGFTGNPHWPYRIAQVQGRREKIKYGLVRVGDGDAPVRVWATPAELCVWRPPPEKPPP